MKLSAIRKSTGIYLAEPVLRLIARTKISPNAISCIGFLISMGAALLIAFQHLIIAGLLILVGGFFDMLDGALARRTKQATSFGGVLDSTLDRLSEGALLLGILGLFLITGRQPVLFTSLSQEWSIVLIFVTLIGSLTVSYVRARAEAAGIECQLGLFTRSERVVVLVLGLFLNQLVLALLLIAIVSFITVGQRLHHVARAQKS